MELLSAFPGLLAKEANGHIYVVDGQPACERLLKKLPAVPVVVTVDDLVEEVKPEAILRACFRPDDDQKNGPTNPEVVGQAGVKRARKSVVRFVPNAETPPRKEESGVGLISQAQKDGARMLQTVVESCVSSANAGGTMVVVFAGRSGIDDAEHMDRCVIVVYGS